MCFRQRARSRICPSFVVGFAPLSDPLASKVAQKAPGQVSRLSDSCSFVAMSCGAVVVARHCALWLWITRPSGESWDLRRIPAKIFRCLEESDAFRGAFYAEKMEGSQRGFLIRKVAILPTFFNRVWNTSPWHKLSSVSMKTNLQQCLTSYLGSWLHFYAFLKIQFLCFHSEISPEVTGTWHLPPVPPGRWYILENNRTEAVSLS